MDIYAYICLYTNTDMDMYIKVFQHYKESRKLIVIRMFYELYTPYIHTYMIYIYIYDVLSKLYIHNFMVHTVRC